MKSLVWADRRDTILSSDQPKVLRVVARDAVSVANVLELKALFNHTIVILQSVKPRKIR